MEDYSLMPFRAREALQLPASVQAALKYTSSSDFGAILMTDSPIEKKAYLYKSPFNDWVRANSRQLLQTRGMEIKEHGLWIIRWTYSTSKASINAWVGTDKRVVVGFKVSTFGTDFGPKGEWHRGHADSSWDDYIPKESTDKLVVFAGALRYRYSKHFWTDAQLKEGEKKKAPTRSSQPTDGPIPLDGPNANDAFLCDEIGADDESEDDED